jgi:hypothetical protein
MTIIVFWYYKGRFPATSNCRLQGFRLLKTRFNEATSPIPSSPGWTLYADGFNGLEIGASLPLEEVGKSVSGAWVTSGLKENLPT